MAAGNKRKICEVCQKEPSKYKCPKCMTPYCSLPCFKKHKDASGSDEKGGTLCERTKNKSTNACEICNQGQSKYKCPSCLIKYCCIACYKSHKEDIVGESSNKCDARVFLQQKTRQPKSLKQHKNKKGLTKAEEEEELEVLLSEEQKQNIMQNYAIRMALKDTQLQALLLQINDGPDRVTALKKAKLSKTFCSQFLDPLLLCIGVHQKDGSGETFLSLSLPSSSSKMGGK
mmetsp:Transcript_41750/g.61532  ORF Transcript_41750/g.61532 Transcript_41750/m.61532 type:complete len:230 (+) Transcript_41750:73-762(+)